MSKHLRGVKPAVHPDQEPLARVPKVPAWFGTYARDEWKRVLPVLVARKVLENWIYWFIIDAVSIYLYVAKGLWLTAALFLLYLAMVVVGYWRWRQAHQQALSHEQAQFAVA